MREQFPNFSDLAVNMMFLVFGLSLCLDNFDCLRDFISVTEDSILDSAGKYEITKINIYTSGGFHLQNLHNPGK